MDKNRRENSLFSCLFLYRSRKTDCFPVCYTKLDRKTDGLAMGIFPALFPSKTWPYNGFLEPCFLALRLGIVFTLCEASRTMLFQSRGKKQGVFSNTSRLFLLLARCSNSTLHLKSINRAEW